MRELRNILGAFASLRESAATGVLASVVAVSGSTYRRPGARMLVLPDEETLGLVSGGCLEGDLVERSRGVRADGEPQLVRYDSTSDDDIVWGLGLGCAGRVDVLLERVDAAHPGPLDLLAECLAARREAVLATALRADGGSLLLGARFALHTDGWFLRPELQQELQPDLPQEPAPITAWIEAEARQCLAAGRTSTRTRAHAGGTDEILFELVPPTVRLLVFGAGPDAGSVVDAAAALGWEVVVLDPRPALARPERFPNASRVVACDPRSATEQVELDGATAAVLMTHHYLHDQAILRALLCSPVRYLGLLGPRQRGDDLLCDLREEGILPDAEQRARVFSPAGLDVGADSPDEIALAVVAEIQAVFHERRGGWLRDRKGPIHDPST